MHRHYKRVRSLNEIPNNCGDINGVSGLVLVRQNNFIVYRVSSNSISIKVLGGG